MSPKVLIPGLLAVLSGCKENLSVPITPRGPDTAGPVMRLAPAHDTLADSTGVLVVHVDADDASGIKSLDLFLLPGTLSFATVAPDSISASVGYPIPLGAFKHSSFRYYARSFDILNHETVTDTVTVTVR